MKGMHWANRTLAVAVGASLLAAPAAEATPNAVPAYGDVRLKGPFGERFDRLVKNHVLANDTASLAAECAARRFRTFALRLRMPSFSA